MDFWLNLWLDTKKTCIDVLPIVAVVIFFQVLVIRKPLPNSGRLILGLVFVVACLSLFLVGLDQALFPLGKLMAQQLTDSQFIYGDNVPEVLARHWYDYGWVFLFAFSIGFCTTIAEPSLIAVAMKANEVSAGSISVKGLRIAVALGVAIGVTIGVFRIVIGVPIHFFIIVGYIMVIQQTWHAPKHMIPLAYDSGGVTTSTVTVPLITALGLGLAEAVPGRNVLIDGFGLIAFASLFPIITVMAYAQIAEFREQQVRYREKFLNAPTVNKQSNVQTGSKEN